MADEIEIRKQMLPMQCRSIEIRANSVNEEKRTVEVVWTTGARVKRSGWFSEPWYEELSLKKSHVRMDRINSGAPVLNAHSCWSLDDVLGAVVEKSAKIVKDDGDDRHGVATLRFDDDSQDAGAGNIGPAEKVFRKIKRGNLKNVSVGYNVHRIEEVGRAEDGLKIFRATDWEPLEISPVPIGADAGAKVREGEKTFECEIITLREQETMADKENPAPANAPTIDEKKVREDAVKAERQRVQDITRACELAGLEVKQASAWIDSGKDVAEVRGLVIEAIAERNKQTNTASANVAVVREEKDTMRRGMADALLHRHNPAAHKLSDIGASFRNLSLIDMARSCLAASGANVSGMGKTQIAKAVFRAGAMSTSDFPLILADVATKTLRAAYETAPATWTPFVRQTTVPDFKEVSRVQLGEGEALEELGEHGEYKQGTVSEAAEKYAIKTYGKMIAVTRKMLINDDLGAFSRLAEIYGRRASELESDLIWGLINANPTMADGKTLFHADHNNLSEGGAAEIDVDSVGAAWAAMRLQTGLDGQKLSIEPRYLFVPVALWTAAAQFVAVTTPNADSEANPYKYLTPASEPRLDDNSSISWYMMAAAGQLDMIELARLEGEGGPVIETEDVFDTDGMKMKVRYDLGAKVIDWRGFQKNAGV